MGGELAAAEHVGDDGRWARGREDAAAEVEPVDGDALGRRASSESSTRRGTTSAPRTSIGSVEARPSSVRSRILSRKAGLRESWKLTFWAPKLWANVASSEWIV